jgi:very-short-patch-repair endonuclease
MPKKSSINMSEVKRLIETEKLSTYGVAEQLGCNQSHVVRLIAKYNKENPGSPISKRDKSEAQKNFIKRTGKHQREGTLHSDDSKERISDSMRDVYDGPKGDEIREKIAQQRQDEWASLNASQKADILQNLKQSSRAKAQSGEGSNFENYLADMLKQHGFQVEQRTKAYTPGQKFHVDIALPLDKIIIEVDGPTHWSPIYGDNELQKVQAKDTGKDNILNMNGWNILRVQDISGSTTRARFVRVLEQVEFIKKFQGTPTTHHVKP